MTFITFVCVFSGGGLGALMRYILHIGFSSDSLFPWTTLGINIAGSFLIGLTWAHCAELAWFQSWGRNLIVVGFLGGFTTFSAFSVETLQLMLHGRFGAAVVYAGASVLACLAAVYCGYRVV